MADIKDTMSVVQAAQTSMLNAENVINVKIPLFPKDVTELKTIVNGIQIVAEEMVSAGQALVNMKMMLYYIERQKREIESQLKTNRSNPSMMSMKEALSNTWDDANNLKYAALDKINQLKYHRDALALVKSALMGGF